MVYYPLSTLMLAGIRDILVISTPQDTPRFQALLGDGAQWGLNLSYCVQPSPDGLAQAFILGRAFVGGSRARWCSATTSSTATTCSRLQGRRERDEGATVFAYHVTDPERYGVVEFDAQRARRRASRKSRACRSATTPSPASTSTTPGRRHRRGLKPSARGELEITDVNAAICAQRQLQVELMGRGYAWLDTGTHDSLLEASQFIATLEKRQGLKVACPEEIAFRTAGSTPPSSSAGAAAGKNGYGQYLMEIADGQVF